MSNERHLIFLNFFTCNEVAPYNTLKPETKLKYWVGRQRENNIQSGIKRI